MKLVLIGGGHFGNNENNPYDLKKIDDKIFSLSEKSHPRLLFVGFNEKANFIYSFIKKHFLELGAQCEILRYKDFNNQKTIDGCFKRADILYLGGGNTMVYMQQIKKYGLDKKIVEFAKQNKVIAGISAGAIILSKFGSSDSRHYKREEKFTLVRGLNILNICFVPHYMSSARPSDMPRFIKKIKSNIAICADNQTALIVNGDDFEVVKSNENAKVYKYLIKNGENQEIELANSGKLVDLMTKQ